MSFQVREEVLNILLAELLEKRGLLSVPETIRSVVSAGKKQKRLPDITVFDLLGLRVIIEGRIGKNAGTKSSLATDAKKRVEEGLSPICLAVIYPPALAKLESLPDQRQELAKAVLSVRVFSENDDGDWQDATVDGITDILSRSYELLVSENVVLNTVAELEGVIDQTSATLATSPATPKRIRKLLGIPEETLVSKPSLAAEESE